MLTLSLRKARWEISDILERIELIRICVSMLRLEEYWLGGENSLWTVPSGLPIDTLAQQS
jgi:hypothetical protein